MGVGEQLLHGPLVMLHEEGHGWGIGALQGPLGQVAAEAGGFI